MESTLDSAPMVGIDTLMLRQKLRLRNERKEPLVLRIEPWADEVTIQSADSVNVAFEGPPGGTIEVEAGASALVVFGWQGSTFEIEE